MNFSYFEPASQFLGIAPSNELDMLKMIETAGKTCYRSEASINEDSCQRFFKTILGKEDGSGIKHFSIFEHSNICFNIESNSSMFDYTEMLLENCGKRQFFKLYSLDKNNRFIIASNIRGWIEFLSFLLHHNTYWVKDSIGAFYSHCFKLHYPFIFQSLLESNLIPEVLPKFSNSKIEVVTEQEQLNYLNEKYWDLPVFVFKFVTDRGISHEMVRHRTLQYSQESTRYVNYNKKIGIQFFNFGEMVSPEMNTRIESIYTELASIYHDLITKEEVKPQFARNILTNGLRTEIVISGTLGPNTVNYSNRTSDEKFCSNTKIDMSAGWARFIKLRGTQAAHPDIRVKSNFVAITLKSIIPNLDNLLGWK